ncbi:MAG: MFS transporter, partial [Myxococcota bacterium]
VATSVAQAWWQLVALQALHGVTFGVFLAAVIAILGRIVPSELRATGQALMYVMVFTVGSIAGNATSGVVYDVHGPVALYQGAGIVEGVALVCAVAYAVHRKRAVLTASGSTS